MAKGRAAVKKRRTVTFDDNTGDVVATEEAGRLAAETEDEESKNDEAEMEADAVEDEEEDISQYLPEGIGPEGIVFKQPIEKDPQAVPVANKNFIPLFPDASKKPKLHATAIKVYKRTPPYDGFKGKVTSIEQVDEEYLSGLWGDGIYDLELIDQMGNILRKNLGVKVAIGGAMNGGNKNEGPSAPAVDVESIVEKITKQSQATIELVMKKLEAERSAERDAAKQERQAEKERNDRFVKLQSDMVESQADQLRAHYEAQAGAASQQTQALLTILTTGHQNMMQQVQAMNLQAQQNNNPVLLLQAFQAGLGERVDAGEKDTTTTIVEGITSGLKDLRGLAEAGNKNGAAPTKQLATGAPTTLAKRPNTGTKPAVKAAPAATGKEPVISKTSLQGILRLKAAAEKKGVAFDDLIAQAEKFYVDGTVPDGILDEEEPEGGPEDEETDDEQGEEGPEDGDGNDESGNKKPAEPPQKPADAVEGT